MDTRARLASLALAVAREVARREREQVCCGDLTFPQYETLRAIQVAGVVTPSDHARAAGIDVSTASRNLALLERKGYVVRARRDGDARRVGVRLSERGVEAVTTLACSARGALDGVVARIPPEQREAVIAALGTLVEALAPAAAPEPARRSLRVEGCAPGDDCCAAPAAGTDR